MKEYKFRISKISTWIAEKKKGSFYCIEFYRGKWQGWQFRALGSGYTKDVKNALQWKVLSEERYEIFDIDEKAAADLGTHWEGATMKGMVEICRNWASYLGADKYVIEETEEVSF